MDHSTTEEEVLKENDVSQGDQDQEVASLGQPPGHHYVFFGGFWVRFWAYMIDLIVVGSLNRIVIYPTLKSLNIPLNETGFVSVVGISTAVILYTYFIVMTKYFGQTLGKMIFGLRVIQQDENKLTWSTVLFREFIGKFISKTALFIGFITVGFSTRKMGWHDWFADTIVIQERKGIVLKNTSI